MYIGIFMHTKIYNFTPAGDAVRSYPHGVVD